METTEEILHSIDSILPNSKVIVDTKAFLDNECLNSEGECSVIIAGEEIIIPQDASISVAGKMLYIWNYDCVYGRSYYRAKAAIGCMTDTQHGWVEAQFGFAILMYQSDARLIKIDWSEKFEFDD